MSSEKSNDWHQFRGDIAGVDHCVVQVSELAQGVAWYQRAFGLVEVARQGARAFLASPVTGNVILGLVEGGTGLEYASYAVYDAASMARIRRRLQAAGLSYDDGITDSRPGARDAVRVTLPTGHLVELLLADDASAAPLPEYRAGALDIRTSHLQIRSLDIAEVVEFLQVLGFKRSSFVTKFDGSDGFYIHFMRVNDRHHQLALLTGPSGLHHVAIELDNADFWKFCDHLAAEHIPAEYGPGRHLEGNMMFIYVRDPFGNRTEITSTMEVVGHDYPTMPCSDDPPHYHMNMWGPQPPESWETEWN